MKMKYLINIFFLIFTVSTLSGQVDYYEILRDGRISLQFKGNYDLGIEAGKTNGFWYRFDRNLNGDPFSSGNSCDLSDNESTSLKLFKGSKEIVDFEISCCCTNGEIDFLFPDTLIPGGDYRYRFDYKYRPNSSCCNASYLIVSPNFVVGKPPKMINPENEIITSTNHVLKWHPQEFDEGYRVIVYENNGSPFGKTTCGETTGNILINEDNLTDTVFQIPPSMLEVGKSYRYYVIGKQFGECFQVFSTFEIEEPPINNDDCMSPWEVVNQPENSTTIFGLVSTNCEFADATDYVGAFIDGECRGLQHVTMTNDSAFVTLVVQEDSANKAIQFKIWDTSECDSIELDKTLQTQRGETIGYPNFILFDECEVVESCRTRDSLILVDLYNATDGANWTNSWDLSQPIDTWFGVTLNNEGCVLGLFLRSNNLVGTMPISIGNLSELETFYADGNQLEGTIPDEFGKLENLRVVYLFNNNLSGGIPSTIGNLRNVERLLLGENNFTGAIPKELGILPKLEDLSLRVNKLTSEIPAELANITTLKSISLDNNKLTGSIPIALGELPNLESLVVYGNRLTGEIPIELGNLSKLEILHLRENELTGTIPMELGNITTLKALHLDQNKLTGSIPSSIGNLTNLESLILRFNELDGNISTEIGNLSNLQNLGLGHNNLIGTIPNSFTNLKKLKTFSVFNNDLSGVIPEGLKDIGIVQLEIGSNNFTFNSVLPFLDIETFGYENQGQIFEEKTVILEDGNNYEIDLGVDDNIASNIYKWYKNGNLITAITGKNKFVFNNIQLPNEGIYHCEVTNPNAPDLTLISHKVTIEVKEVISGEGICECGETNEVDCPIIPTTAGTITFSSQAQLDSYTGELTNYNITIDGDDITAIPFSFPASVHDLNIRNNPLLANLDNLNSLKHIFGNLTILNNNSLKDVNGLSNVGDLRGDLIIADHPVLENIKGLEKIYQSQSISIRNNDKLEQLDGLKNLSCINGSLTIQENLVLNNIDNLSKLTQITSNLMIFDNNSLKNLDGFINLETIGNQLIISENTSLSHVDGFINLTTIESSISIFENAALEHLDGCANLINIGGTITVRNNPKLADCCGIFPLVNSVTSTINNNLLGCNAISEIATDCSILCAEAYIVLTDTVSENKVFKSKESIISSAQILLGREVVYIAEKSIILQFGFHAKLGSDFHAFIEPCVNDDLLITVPRNLNQRIEETVVEESLQIRPNPAMNEAIITYSMSINQPINLLLVSATSGQLVEMLERNSWKDKGEYDYNIDASKLPQGIYFVILQGKDFVKNEKLIIVR